MVLILVWLRPAVDAERSSCALECGSYSGCFEEAFCAAFVLLILVVAGLERVCLAAQLSVQHGTRYIKKATSKPDLVVCRGVSSSSLVEQWPALIFQIILENIHTVISIEIDILSEGLEVDPPPLYTAIFAQFEYSQMKESPIAS